MTTTASSKPRTTHYITHVTTKTRTGADGNTTPIVVVITTTTPVTTGAATSGQSTTSAPAALSGSDSSGSSSSGGLSTAGITAIAVVVPVAVVALLVGLGIFFWRKRKNKKDAEEQRRKEVEDYSYNPNGDPTLPAVGSEAGGTQMTQDHSSGYRGWGAATASNRKASTTLSGGHTQQLSDSGNSGSNAYGGPSSPSANYSDGHSSDPIMNNQRDTMNSDDLGALGVAPATGNQSGIRRGPSNASSAYSAGGRSEHSDDAPPLPSQPIGQAYDYNPGQNYGYGQHGPYGDGTYGGGPDNGMPVVQDVSARRNTRIQPGGAYQQGNSGIAQNF